MTNIQQSHSVRQASILDERGRRAFAVRTDNDAISLVALPTEVGRRLSRAVVRSVGGTLLTAAVTGVLYLWGRLYYEAFLNALGHAASTVSVPFDDLLFAPLATLLSTWTGIASTIAVFGVLGMAAPLMRALARRIRVKVRRTKWTWIQKIFRKKTTALSRSMSSEEQDDNELFASATHPVLMGLCLLVAGLLIAVGGIAAAGDGKKDGEKALAGCRKVAFGSVVNETGQLVGAFCTRVGEDVVMFVKQDGSVRIARWDNQQIYVVPK